MELMQLVSLMSTAQTMTIIIAARVDHLLLDGCRRVKLEVVVIIRPFKIGGGGGKSEFSVVIHWNFLKFGELEHKQFDGRRDIFSKCRATATTTAATAKTAASSYDYDDASEEMKNFYKDYNKRTRNRTKNDNRQTYQASSSGKNFMPLWHRLRSDPDPIKAVR